VTSPVNVTIRSGITYLSCRLERCMAESASINQPIDFLYHCGSAAPRPARQINCRKNIRHGPLILTTSLSDELMYDISRFAGFRRLSPLRCWRTRPCRTGRSARRATASLASNSRQQTPCVPPIRPSSPIRFRSHAPSTNSSTASSTAARGSQRRGGSRRLPACGR
jgi:hypothetical protein